MSNRWYLIKAYADVADKETADSGVEEPWKWWRTPDYLTSLNNLDITDKAAKNSAYHAYRAGMLDKSETEENAYRIAQPGRDYLARNPEPPVQGTNLKKARAAKAKKAKKETKAKTNQKVNETVALGTLFEVVGLDGDGHLMARNTDNNVVYRMEKI